MTPFGPWLVLGALAIDGVFGDPPWLWQRLRHPVTWFGALIGWLDRRLNCERDGELRRRALGGAAVAVLAAVAGGGGWLLASATAAQPLGWLLEAILASTLIAQRSLYHHVAAVAEALEAGGLNAGRRAVAQIVGRDPDSLDEPGVVRAAIESCAENFSDGVVAPAFWYALGGLPGLVVYKAVNTADSMIGHRSPRYLAFGWAAARLDDLLNLLPARLAGLLLALAAGRNAWRGLAVMWRDAGGHRSPNAGWPEAAMAGALGLALAGPRRYGGTEVADAWMGAGGRAVAGPAEIRRALRLLVRACIGLWLVVAAAGGLFALA
ncbi:MAG: cobalamin biosynthesis protein [Azospirillum sp.]|nr:cobalamin biosynthesis protein [Azospirillum sp.]